MQSQFDRMKCCNRAVKYSNSILKIYKFKSEVGIAETRNDCINACMLNAEVGIFPLSYAIIPSFLVSVLFIIPYF